MVLHVLIDAQHQRAAVCVQTDGTSGLLLQVERMPLLRRLDCPKPVDTMGINRLVDFLHRPNDARLPAHAVDGVAYGYTNE